MFSLVFDIYSKCLGDVVVVVLIVECQSCVRSFSFVGLDGFFDLYDFMGFFRKQCCVGVKFRQQVVVVVFSFSYFEVVVGFVVCIERKEGVCSCIEAWRLWFSRWCGCFCSLYKMNVGNFFQDVNIFEFMKKLDIFGDNGVIMSDRFLVSCFCFGSGVLCGFCFVLF